MPSHGSLAARACVQVGTGKTAGAPEVHPVKLEAGLGQRAGDKALAQLRL